jgi:hypothetical protein
MIDTLSYFEDVIQATLTHGHKQNLIITGENATGKSFIRRLVYVICKQENIELIHLSQQGRCTTGIPSAMIYGDESYNSTGYNTSTTIMGGINTCNNRDKDHFILWDEPDIGLSEKYSAGVGVAIRGFVENIPAHTRGSIVITHSKSLVRQLLPLNPTHLRLGDTLSLNDWLREIPEPGDLDELKKRNHAMYLKINEIINTKNK